MDLDIDFLNRDAVLADLEHVPATRHNRDGTRSKHLSGVYFQDAPVDPTDGLCAFDFRQAEELGYFKVDFLNNSIYEGVRDEAHLIDLLTTEPDWALFRESDVVDRLAHIRDHFEIVREIAPQSIEDLSIILALIRPGKRHLIGKPRYEIDAEVWTPGVDGYVFKKSHSVAFAASIVVQLNLMIEQASREDADA